MRFKIYNYIYILKLFLCIRVTVSSDLHLDAAH